MLWNERYKIAADPSAWQTLIGIGEHIVRPFIDQANLAGDVAHNLTNGGTYKFVLVPDHGIDPNGYAFGGHKYISIPDVKEIAKQTADWKGSKPAWAAEAGGVAGYAVRSVVDKIKALRSKLSEPHPIIETLKELDRLENRNSSAARKINILSATINGNPSGAGDSHDEIMQARIRALNLGASLALRAGASHDEILQAHAKGADLGDYAEARGRGDSHDHAMLNASYRNR